jgi:hypothetical protein
MKISKGLNAKKIEKVKCSFSKGITVNLLKKVISMASQLSIQLKTNSS